MTLSVPRATIHVRCRHGPARALHTAPLHRVHPWGVGDSCLASQPMQRAHSGDAGGLRRDIAAAAHTHKSSGSPGPPCSGDWSMIYYPVASGGTPSRPILIAGAPESSPSGLLRLPRFVSSAPGRASTCAWQPAASCRTALLRAMCRPKSAGENMFPSRIPRRASSTLRPPHENSVERHGRARVHSSGHTANRLGLDCDVPFNRMMFLLCIAAKALFAQESSCSSGTCTYDCAIDNHNAQVP